MEKLMVTHRLSLDMNNQAVQATITLAQYDTATHRLIVSLRNEAEVVELPPGSYAVAVQDSDINSDGKIDELDSVTVYGPDSVYPNCIVYDVSEAVTAIEGMHEAQFLITYVDESGTLRQLSSPRIAFVIKPDIMRKSDIQKTSYYGAVVQALNDAKTARDEAQDAQEAAEDARDAAIAVGVISEAEITKDGGLLFKFSDGREVVLGDKVVGPPGEDGYTPVRGTDYWTDADIAEIKKYVDDAILGGAW